MTDHDLSRRSAQRMIGLGRGHHPSAARPCRPIQVGDQLLPLQDYLRRHLPDPTAVAGMIDEAVTPAFLPNVNVARLRGLLSRVSSHVEDKRGLWVAAWQRGVH